MTFDFPGRDRIQIVTLTPSNPLVRLVNLLVVVLDAVQAVQILDGAEAFRSVPKSRPVPFYTRDANIAALTALEGGARCGLGSRDRHSFVAVYPGAREGGDTDNDVFAPAGSGVE